MSEGTFPEDGQPGTDGAAPPDDAFFLGTTATHRRRKVSGKLVLLIALAVALCIPLTIVLTRFSATAGRRTPATTSPAAGSGTSPTAVKSSPPSTQPDPSTTQNSPATTQPGPSTTESSPTTTQPSRPKTGTGEDLMSAGLASRTFSQLWPRLYDDVFTDPFDLSHVATLGVIHTLEAGAECGCGLLIPRTPDPLDLTAPIEAAYPLSFLAELNEPRYRLAGRPAPFVMLVVCERLSPRAPWIVSDMVAYGGAITTLGATSYATMHTDPRALAYPLSPLFRQLAGVFESARESGHLPRGNEWDHTEMVETEQPGNTILSLIAEHDSFVAGGVALGGWYRVVQQSRVFDTASGTLQCAEIDGMGSAVGGNQVQPADRHEYGPGLPPGAYSAVTTMSARDVCVISGTPRTFSFNGIQGGTYRITGKPISAT